MLKEHVLKRIHAASVRYAFNWVRAEYADFTCSCIHEQERSYAPVGVDGPIQDAYSNLFGAPQYDEHGNFDQGRISQEQMVEAAGHRGGQSRYELGMMMLAMFYSLVEDGEVVV